MIKVDFKRQLRALYQPPVKEISLVDVPPMNYLTIEGENAEIDNPYFQEAIQALFAISYKAKFIAKEKLQKDFVVMPLEGLWWAKDMNDFITGNKKNWKWQLLIMQPEFLTQEIIDEAKSIQFNSKKIAAIQQSKLAKFHEGKCMQLMHIGAFSEEGPAIAKLHQAIKESNGRFDGQVQKHHEIYLSDFRKTDPNKLRTILRQPFL